MYAPYFISHQVNVKCGFMQILEVVTKTLAFHTSVSYQVSAPQPFANDVHEDILGDLARIASTSYNSAFDLHIDISRSVKRLNDGHCAYIDMCFDSLFLSFVPLPLVLLTDEQGVQAVHIAPEAFTVASAEFGDEISFWQNALPGSLNGQLQSVSLPIKYCCWDPTYRLFSFYIVVRCQGACY